MTESNADPPRAPASKLNVKEDLKSLPMPELQAQLGSSPDGLSQAEAMTTVLSVTMAVGARLLAKKEAIVTRLAAIEKLTGVDVLCSDKTGTLTQNKLTLGDPFSVNNITVDQVILNAALASREDNKDTIDLAVLGGLKNYQALKGYQVVHFQPFDPVHKRTEATVRGADEKEFKVTKGAPQVILELSANAGQITPEVEKAVDEFAARGFRSLGVARSDQEGKWQFDGVLPLFDPPREQAKATIATARQMGVNLKMVTGDQVAIARETAGKLGLGTNILDASGFGDTKHHETAQLAESIEKADGFAQVFPEHKFHIVDVLQKRGHIVGMTGEGVNDAPALKKADCGIAVSGATDAARAAASIVLMTPGLPNLLLDPEIWNKVMASEEKLRCIVCTAAELGVPAPGLMTALGYLDGYRSAWLPANLIQAQRDYFGAHTYERIDAKGTFHTEWGKN